jgi:class 3 adenylate cyclase
MDALEQKIHALSGYEAVGEKLAKRFGALLRQQDDWGLFRVNPLSFGARYDLPPRVALDLFIHAARVGLFDFAFNQLCLGCGGVAYSHESLNQVGIESFHCSTCDVTYDASLDERLEVAFTISPSVHKLSIDPYRDMESYGRTFFSGNMQRSPAALAAVRHFIHGFVSVAPDEKQVLELTTRPGLRAGLLSIDTHSRIEFDVVPGATLGPQLGFHPHGPDARRVTMGVGEVKLTITNYGGRAAAGLVGEGFAMKAASMSHPPTWQPFVTGKMLLNNQAFRDLFRVQALAPDLKLSLKSLTLLFTDLKGSTELYDRTGDVYAYQVVQEHFRLLSEAVRRHDGAIVKTMGDAIMASFSTSRDAVAAAVEMMKAMEAVNAKVKAAGHETGLKVGLHEGSALAVNAESRLDYFGQTVNIAARVQALASSGEIWISEPVLAAEGVGDALKGAGLDPERRVVALKGVGAPTPVFRLSAR